MDTLFVFLNRFVMINRVVDVRVQILDLEIGVNMTNPPLCFVSRAIMSDKKAVIKNADMSEDMQQDAVECATQALEKFNIEKDIAAFIKKVNAANAASNF